VVLEPVIVHSQLKQSHLPILPEGVHELSSKFQFTPKKCLELRALRVDVLLIVVVIFLLVVLFSQFWTQCNPHEIIPAEIHVLVINSLLLVLNLDDLDEFGGFLIALLDFFLKRSRVGFLLSLRFLGP
jgi:hypothetical protein